ncbi:uncharacterized protein FSUBG_1781 [Fusarium subglutinans]|uniref:Uncharacterized protein n=1 Tax=Gibberella subglutinans TaxID=42677 RepID=A0A8H5V7W3_GIBSU|nr:uncharacterized protein FSUBG_1781 [Fusarium subglutinans]KAF5612050.1 hypothetical protein FSUBG_1781 [Fusarium subglutinans]
MADMSYEDTQHLLDSIASTNFDQRLNDHMDGTEEVDEDTKVDMFTSLNNSAFQNPQAQYGIDDEALLTSNPFEKEFMEAYQAENARTQTSSGSDAQLSGPNNNGSTIADDDSQVPVSSAVTPATQFSSPMNPEDYLPESFQTQPYPPLNNQPQSYPIPMGQSFYDQPALQQMQPFPVRQPAGLGGRQIRRTRYPQQQLFFSMNSQLHQPLPGPVSHPAFQVSQPHNPLSQAPPHKGPAPNEPIRHKIPTNPANINPHTLEQQSLLSELQHFTHEYQGYITNPVQARQIGNLFLSLAHHEVTVTPPDMDPTFPRTNEAYRARVQELFMAIVDWSNPRGWRTKMGSKLAVQWVEEVTAYRKSVGLSVEPSDMLDHQIEPPIDRMPPVNEQWKNVVHRQLSNIEIEILSSKILDNKVLIHSALRSSWLSRITNSPVAELVRKENNKAGNDKKRNAASRLSGKGGKRPQNEESEDEEVGRKTKKKRH